MDVPNRFIINLATRMIASGVYEDVVIRDPKVPNDGSKELTISCYGTSYDGDALTLKNEEGKSYHFGGMLRLGEGAEMRYVAPPPLVSFSTQKKIVRTELVGGGSVVEHIASGDYSIRMKGILVDMEKHRYPEEGIKELYKLFSYTNSYKVISKPFEHLGIERMYMDSMDVEGVEGYEDTFVYTLTGFSLSPMTFSLVA